MPAMPTLERAQRAYEFTKELLDWPDVITEGEKC